MESVDQKARAGVRFTWLGDIEPREGLEAEPLRFRLGELFVVVTAAAVVLAVFRALGIFGAVLSFWSAVAFTNWIYPRIRPRREQETMFDFMWGIVMPVVCLTYDPFVFKSDDLTGLTGPGVVPSLQPSLAAIQFHVWSAAAYLFIGWQLLALAVCLICGRLPGEMAAVWSGMLWIGFGFACLVGVVLFVPAVFGIMALGIGFLGFTPWFTARAFFRRTTYAGMIGMGVSHWRKLMLLGVWLTLPVLALGGLAGLLLSRS